MNGLKRSNQFIHEESFKPGLDNSSGGVPPRPEQALPVADIPQRLRRLRWDEVVGRGDFVANERRGFDLWDGPTGFRADAYVRQIYRRIEGRFTRGIREAP